MYSPKEGDRRGRYASVVKTESWDNGVWIPPRELSVRGGSDDQNG
ncbi:MAG: hypothetical protein WCD18_18335 [Thermosynechococcaceae cyanobacterium]